jgi:hypothetical protein
MIKEDKYLKQVDTLYLKINDLNCFIRKGESLVIPVQDGKRKIKNIKINRTDIAGILSIMRKWAVLYG